MPGPPTTIDEAFKRCPHESDTVAVQALETIEEMERIEQPGKDSLPARKNKNLQKIQSDIENQKRSLRVTMDSLTSFAAKQLLNEVRIIGESLDTRIMNCPKVGERPQFDSACVQSAEAEAKRHRFAASQKFLGIVGECWQSIFPRTKAFIAAQEEQLRKMSTGAKKPEQQSQFKRAYSDLWEMIKTLLKSIDEITRLAVRFSKT